MVAIVGGGIAGLAAAYELATRGIPFALFEASDRLGGLVRTEHADGFTIEAGADSMLAQKRAGLDLCAELGLTPRLIAPKDPRTAFVLHRGRLHALPSPSMFGIPATWRQIASYALLPVVARARLAIEPFVPVRTDRADEAVAAFFRRRFGAATVGLLAQPLLGGIHAGDVEALSLPALFPRLAEAERSGRTVLRWVRQTARAGEAGGAFRSLSSGMGELVESIRRRLPAGAVHCGSAVTSLARHGSGWELTTAGGRGQFAAVILACPAHAAAGILAPIDPRAAEICAQVRYVSTVSIALGWPRDAISHPLHGSGFVVARASNAVRITACTWVSSKWDGRAPAGRALLRAYAGGAHDPAAVDMSDEELIDLAAGELSAILSISGPPALARVYRWRDAGAQHEVGHLARMQELDERLARHRGLFVTGSGFRSIGIPDCVADARAVAVHAGGCTHET
ncbi:MAG TPA: protoporphyrinogen oxidase [Vicinamibacterales bacterium]|nr:protoporphyrinogen oxidase [Vicinamibacterales bacterium]